MTSRPAPSADPPVRVGAEGLLAALPALLGFRPRDSLVLVATGGPGGRRVGLTLRVDLPPTEDPELVAALARSTAATLARDRPTGAAVLLVGGGGPRVDLASAVVLALLDHQLDVHTVAWATAIEPGAEWACCPPSDCGCAGTLPDPDGTVVAATAVAGGAVLYRSREELAAQLAPVEPGADALGAPPRDPWQALRAGLAAAAAGRLVVTAPIVRSFRTGFRDPRFRDAALATCVGEQAAAAEQLWAALARTSPGPAAADPAVLLAVCALARGDGALANVALDRALTARPGHRLAGDLGRAVQAGWGPAEIRTWLDGAR